ncbi:hypothetical protein D3C84_647220 [compost metagenome]
MSAGMRRFCCISAIRAKQNSPPWASARPLRQAVSPSLPRHFTRMATTQPLMSIKPRVNPRINKPSSRNSCRSISMPMLTKNSPSRMSRNGRMSASI